MFCIVSVNYMLCLYFYLCHFCDQNWMKILKRFISFHLKLPSIGLLVLVPSIGKDLTKFSFSEAWLLATAKQ